MRTATTAVLVVLALVLASPAAVPAGAASLNLDFASADPAVGALLPVGGALYLRGVPLEPAGDLVLRRIRVFAPDAELVVHTEGGEERLPVPDHAYFVGGVAGVPGSRAFLSLLDSGEVRGLVAGGGRFWMIGRQPAEALTRVVEVDPALLAAAGSDFHCATDELGAAELIAEGPAAGTPAGAVFAPVAESGAGPSHTARIAIESDNEFLALFGGNTSAAIGYIGDVFAFGSSIYVAETGTSLEVTSVSLWQSTDPWVQLNTTCRFLEFGRWWNDNRGGVSRTVAHFLSGRTEGSGIGWVGVLCGGGFDTDISGAGCSLSPSEDNYGGGYAYSSGLDVDFNPGNPQMVWDLVVVIHEIGHNFNSPHTHCYAGVGGNANPVDQCYNGQCGQSNCHCGNTSLPCPAGNPGCGTIMSYCHFQGGGFANIAPSFGAGHPWGVAPGRVPSRMSAHVAQRASSNPGCLDPVQPTVPIFADGFEAGNTVAWSETVGG